MISTNQIVLSIYAFICISIVKALLSFDLNLHILIYTI